MISSMSINVNNQLYWEYYVANSVKFQQCAKLCIILYETINMNIVELSCYIYSETKCAGFQII